MQIPVIIDAPDHELGEFDEVLAQKLALEMAESAIGSPVQGSALLRAGAILAAYLATHEPDPERAVAALVAEFSGNVHLCLVRLRGATAGTPAQAMVEPLAVPADPVAPASETPLEEALRRLEAGEQLGVVADEVGIPMPKLRGIWAKRVRDQKEAAPATVTCTGCDRDYLPGAEDEGLCARCTRDLGRG